MRSGSSFAKSSSLLALGGQLETGTNRAQPPGRHDDEPVIIVIRHGLCAARGDVVQGLTHRNPMRFDRIGHRSPAIAASLYNASYDIRDDQS